MLHWNQCVGGGLHRCGAEGEQGVGETPAEGIDEVAAEVGAQEVGFFVRVVEQVVQAEAAAVSALKDDLMAFGFEHDAVVEFAEQAPVERGEDGIAVEQRQ